LLVFVFLLVIIIIFFHHDMASPRLPLQQLRAGEWETIAAATTTTTSTIDTLALPVPSSVVQDTQTPLCMPLRTPPPSSAVKRKRRFRTSTQLQYTGGSQGSASRITFAFKTPVTSAAAHPTSASSSAAVAVVPRNPFCGPYANPNMDSFPGFEGMFDQTIQDTAAAGDTQTEVFHDPDDKFFDINNMSIDMRAALGEHMLTASTPLSANMSTPMSASSTSRHRRAPTPMSQWILPDACYASSRVSRKHRSRTAFTEANTSTNTNNSSCSSSSSSSSSSTNSSSSTGSTCSDLPVSPERSTPRQPIKLYDASTDTVIQHEPGMLVHTAGRGNTAALVAPLPHQNLYDSLRSVCQTPQGLASSSGRRIRHRSALSNSSLFSQPDTPGANVCEPAMFELFAQFAAGTPPTTLPIPAKNAVSQIRTRASPNLKIQTPKQPVISPVFGGEEVFSPIACNENSIHIVGFDDEDEHATHADVVASSTTAHSQRPFNLSTLFEDGESQSEPCSAAPSFAIAHSSRSSSLSCSFDADSIHSETEADHNTSTESKPKHAPLPTHTRASSRRCLDFTAETRLSAGEDANHSHSHLNNSIGSTDSIREDDELDASSSKVTMCPQHHHHPQQQRSSFSPHEPPHIARPQSCPAHCNSIMLRVVPVSTCVNCTTCPHTTSYHHTQSFQLSPIASNPAISVENGVSNGAEIHIASPLMLPHAHSHSPSLSSVSTASSPSFGHGSANSSRHFFPSAHQQTQLPLPPTCSTPPVSDAVLALSEQLSSRRLRSVSRGSSRRSSRSYVQQGRPRSSSCCHANTAVASTTLPRKKLRKFMSTSNTLHLLDSSIEFDSSSSNSSNNNSRSSTMTHKYGHSHSHSHSHNRSHRHRHSRSHSRSSSRSSFRGSGSNNTSGNLFAFDFSTSNQTTQPLSSTMYSSAPSSQPQSTTNSRSNSISSDSAIFARGAASAGVSPVVSPRAGRSKTSSSAHFKARLNDSRTRWTYASVNSRK
jgi:hypothetical protein